MKTVDCVFCDLIARGGFEQDWWSTVSITPLNPVTPGHLLIVPKTHVQDATTNPTVTAQTMQWASVAARELYPCNIITSAGQLATQTVWHLHVHIIPRREGDGLLLPWSNQHD